jgi:hypothetical protein
MMGSNLTASSGFPYVGSQKVAIIYISVIVFYFLDFSTRRPASEVAGLMPTRGHAGSVGPLSKRDVNVHALSHRGVVSLRNADQARGPATRRPPPARQHLGLSSVTPIPIAEVRRS